MITLYHGDTSVCSQKVRLVLHEKNIEWHGAFIDLGKREQLAPDYLRLNPNGVIPTLVHDDDVIIESSVINEYLDDRFPETPLKPFDPLERARMRLWVKQLDDGIHNAINTISFAIAFRVRFLEQPAAVRKERFEKMPDRAKSAKLKELVEKGVESSHMTEALKRLDKMLADMQCSLEDNSWLASSTYSLADVGFIPYVNRMAMLGLGALWEENRPHVKLWYETAKNRPSFKKAILDHDPAESITLMNKAGVKEWPGIRIQMKSLAI